MKLTTIAKKQRDSVKTIHFCRKPGDCLWFDDCGKLWRYGDVEHYPVTLYLDDLTATDWRIIRQ